MICYETAYTGSNIADKFKMASVIDLNYARKHFKMMMFFNCYVRMPVYSTEGSSQSYPFILVTRRYMAEILPRRL